MDIQALFESGIVSVLQLHFIKMFLLIFEPAQSDLSLLTSVSSFGTHSVETTALWGRKVFKIIWKQIKSCPSCNPLYLHSALHQDSFSLSFPRPFPHCVKSLCVLSHPFCNSQTDSLKGMRCNQLGLISASNCTHVHLSLHMQKSSCRQWQMCCMLVFF